MCAQIYALKKGSCCTWTGLQIEYISLNQVHLLLICICTYKHKNTIKCIIRKRTHRGAPIRVCTSRTVGAAVFRARSSRRSSRAPCTWWPAGDKSMHREKRIQHPEFRAQLAPAWCFMFSTHRIQGAGVAVGEARRRRPQEPRGHRGPLQHTQKALGSRNGNKSHKKSHFAAFDSLGKQRFRAFATASLGAQKFSRTNQYF